MELSVAPSNVLTALFYSVHRGADRVECKKQLKMRFLWLDVCSWRGVAWRGVAWRATPDKWTNDERKEKGNRRECVAIH